MAKIDFLRWITPKPLCSTHMVAISPISIYYIIMEKPNYPHITFHINKGLDKKIGQAFLDDGQKAGYDFVKLIIKLHPELKNYFKVPKKERGNYLIQYINAYYDSHRIEIDNAKNEFRFIWEGAESSFFVVVDKYFKKLKWPTGKYKCYISIFPIGPRFLNTKEFQTCYTWKKNLKGQIMHEMLHFQFYNLIDALDLSEKKDAEFIWEFSEVFNDVVLREHDFVNIQGYRSKQISYPHLKDKFTLYKKNWVDKKDASLFVSKILN